MTNSHTHQDGQVTGLAVYAEMTSAQHSDQQDLEKLPGSGQSLLNGNRAEPARSSREIRKHPANPMKKGLKIGIGCYLIVLGAAVLAILPWAWSLATSTISSPPGVLINAHFLWFGFSPTTDFSLMIIVMLMAIVGSIAVTALTFANRAGHETLQRGYLWWYLTRPIAAAGVGVLFYMTVIAGYFNQAAGQGRTALVVAAAIGGLAGLFTDQILKKMRGILGQTAFNKSATEKE